MTQQQLHEKARKLVTYLGDPAAIAKKGAVWCSTYALMLTMSLNSCTQEEADERLVVMCNDIEMKLGAQ